MELTIAKLEKMNSILDSLLDAAHEWWGWCEVCIMQKGEKLAMFKALEVADEAIRNGDRLELHRKDEAVSMYPVSRKGTVITDNWGEKFDRAEWYVTLDGVPTILKHLSW